MPKQAMDLTGKIFGKLTVIGKGEDYVYPSSQKHEPRWICRCSCEEHNIVHVIQHNLLNGHCHSCGCDSKSAFKDLTGQTFGKLTVIKRVEDYVSKNGDKEPMWLCECSCEKHTRLKVRGHSLKTGHTKSCGCAIGQSGKTHGCHSSPLYPVYKNMVSRCYDEKNSHYDRYGGRGIYICDEWLQPVTGIQKFIEWAYNSGYKENSGLTIDRIDNNGPYAPWNCRWATRIEQANNKENNVLLTMNGVTHTISEWSRIVGISSFTLYARKANGMTDEQALTTPLDYGHPNYYANSMGETHTIREWSNITGIAMDTLYDRIGRNGWDVDRALTTPVKPLSPYLQYNGDCYEYRIWDYIMGFSLGTTYNRVINNGYSANEALTTPNDKMYMNAIYFVDDDGTPYNETDWEKLHPSSSDQ